MRRKERNRKREKSRIMYRKISAKAKNRNTKGEYGKISRYKYNRPNLSDEITDEGKVKKPDGLSHHTLTRTQFEFIAPPLKQD